MPWPGHIANCLVSLTAAPANDGARTLTEGATCLGLDRLGLASTLAMLRLIAVY